MTCPPLLRRRPARADAIAEQTRAGSDTAPEDVAASGPVAALTDWLRSDGGLAQFSRFVLVGGVSSAVYALLFVLFNALGSQPANVIAATASSILANELHRRVTFRAEERVHWFRAQWEAGGVSLIGMVATTLALGWLEATVGDAGVAVELALVGAVFGAIGLMRFLALRWMFVLLPTHEDDSGRRRSDVDPSRSLA